MLDLALHIVETKAGHFDPDRFEDRYEEAVAELIKAKRAGKAPPTAAEPRPSNVVDLMDALRRSVKAERPSGSHKGAPRSQRPQARQARRAEKATPQEGELACGARDLPAEAQVRRHRRAARPSQPRARATSTSSRSMRRAACITTSGSSSTAC